MSDRIPRLPEHYKGETVLGMMPDEIIFPSGASLLAVDRESNQLYVQVDHTVYDYERSPAYFGSGRLALMKVLYVGDGDELEGYLADLRHLEPGTVYGRDFSVAPDMSESDAIYTSQMAERHHPLLGAVFYDVDGTEAYDGHPALITHAATLACALDTLQEATDNELIRDIEYRVDAALKPVLPDADNVVSELGMQ